LTSSFDFLVMAPTAMAALHGLIPAGDPGLFFSRDPYNRRKGMAI
jgi:hypothetical protein